MIYWRHYYYSSLSFAVGALVSATGWCSLRVLKARVCLLGQRHWCSLPQANLGLNFHVCVYALTLPRMTRCTLVQLRTNPRNFLLAYLHIVHRTKYLSALSPVCAHNARLAALLQLLSHTTFMTVCAVFNHPSNVAKMLDSCWTELPRVRVYWSSLVLLSWHIHVSTRIAVLLYCIYKYAYRCFSILAFKVHVHVLFYTGFQSTRCYFILATQVHV